MDTASQTSLIEKLMRDLQLLCRSTERERAEYALEKLEFEQKIMSLEATVYTKDRILRDYMRRVSLLEYALKMERSQRDQAEKNRMESKDYVNKVSSVDMTLPSIEKSFAEHIEALENISRQPRVKSCKQILRKYLQDYVPLEDTSRLSQSSAGDFGAQIDITSENESKSFTGPSFTNSGPDLKCCLSIPCSLQAVRCLTSDSDGRSLLCTGSDDGLICTWSIRRLDVTNTESPLSPRKNEERQHPEPTATFRGHNGLVTNLIFVDNDDIIVSSGVDGTIRSWQVPNPTKYDSYGSVVDYPVLSEGIVDAHDDAIWCLKANKRLICSGAADGSVKLWKTSGERFGHSSSQLGFITSFGNILPASPLRVPTAIAWHPFDKEKIIVCFSDSSCSLIDLDKCQIICNYAIDDDAFSVATCAESFSSFACVSVGFRNGTVKALDLNAGLLVNSYHVDRESVGVMAITPTESKYFASGYTDGFVRLWDSRNTERPCHEIQLNSKKFDEGVNCLRYTSGLVTSGSANGFVHFLSVSQ